MSTQSKPNGYWNGNMKVDYRVVNVRLLDSDKFPLYWAKPFIGEVVQAVQVIPIPPKPQAELTDDEKNYYKPFYMDNRDGSGLFKIITGYGAPNYPHRGIAACEEVGEEVPQSEWKQLDREEAARIEKASDDYWRVHNPEKFERMQSLKRAFKNRNRVDLNSL